jgi:hypothetical protein
MCKTGLKPIGCSSTHKSTQQDLQRKIGHYTTDYHDHECPGTTSMDWPVYLHTINTFASKRNIKLGKQRYI